MNFLDNNGYPYIQDINFSQDTHNIVNDRRGLHE